ncbi:putative nucleic acid-binding Zn ribbon protein [Salana multivorans]|uniref:Putative nucleic acid-binding Zn ribbon protein n=1 Tax=Salana multivorans TaxID=120377 RepID=A0A3N2DB49_9MICO|nr:DciA family protein [Salana multivorans]ROR96674.1 putative nucleic acid-binding Zn ribbon protein [Salana multivorans]
MSGELPDGAAATPTDPTRSTTRRSPGSPDGAGAPTTPTLPTDPTTGEVDAAAAALGRARAAAKAKGLVPGTPARRRRSVPGTGPGFPRTRGRDPELIGGTLDKLLAERGWTAPVAVGSVIGRWREVVGDEVADHATPETFTDGRLVVRTTSTAWATQLRLLLPQLERRLAEEVGEGVVAEVVVLGPGAPSWVKGLRVVRGRGPRDTYG